MSVALVEFLTGLAQTLWEHEKYGECVQLLTGFERLFERYSVKSSTVGHFAVRAAAILGETAATHLAELGDLPAGSVPRVIMALRRIEGHRREGRVRTALDEAYGLLELIPTFLPLHWLLAGLYDATNLPAAACAKAEALSALYQARGEAVSEAMLPVWPSPEVALS
jgi:hypothetical protein